MQLRLAGVVLFAFAAAGAPSVSAQLPAFPGAEGPGATATGGRAGDVYNVTNLEYDLDGVIPGSLKYGINTAPAAGRTIVFDVGGTIFHDGGGAGWWFRSGKSNITVAGQTAPGPGITIAGVGSKWTGDNVILRNIAIRPNKDPVSPTSFTYDGISTQLTNSIIDHVSATWHSDEGISSTDAGHTTTVQYALIGEGLNYNSHSYGSIISTEVDGAQLSFHHNLYAHNNSRVPRLGSEMAVTQTGAVTNFSNNVIYNWINRAGYSGTDQPSSTNFLGNYYIKGNNNGGTLFTGGDSATNPGVTKIYHSGNLYDSNKNGALDGTAVTNSNFAGSKLLVSAGFSVAGVGALDSATTALARVLEYSGANWANRNPIDARIVQGVRDGTGAIVNDLTAGVQAAEWATVLAQRPTAGVAPFSRTANWDTDGDGMPDAWEGAHGLDPATPAHNGDFDADGYTDLEEYINEIAAWPAPGVIAFSGAAGDGRFARIQNWQVTGQSVNLSGQGVVATSSNWQPSQFDEAHVNAGVVAVDAAGQHARRLKVANGAGDSATLNITSGWIVVEDALTIGGQAASQGALNLSGGLLRTARMEKGAASTVTITGGVLSADEVTFSLVNSGGTLAPGAGIGALHVLGDLTLSGGTVALDVAGAGPGQYDRLVVDGQLAAGGTVDVSLDGFAPGLGDGFDLLDFGSFSGAWNVALPALAPGLAWDASQLSTTGHLSVVADLANDPDFNDDLQIGGEDFLIWQRGWGLTDETNDDQGDANADGAVDSADLAAWTNQFGDPLGGAAAVPEPAGGALAAFACVAVRLVLCRIRHGGVEEGCTRGR